MKVRITEPWRECSGELDSMTLTKKEFAGRKKAGKKCYDVILETGKNLKTMSMAVPEEYIEIEKG